MISAIIAVRDVDASIAFYTQKLGFVSDGTVTSTDGKTLYGNARLGEDIQFMFNGFPDPLLALGTRGLGVEFHVALPAHIDIDSLYARFGEQGVEIVARIREEYWGERRFTIVDPDGYFLSFVRQVGQPFASETVEELTSATA